jgi:hypothetical protein
VSEHVAAAWERRINATDEDREQATRDLLHIFKTKPAAGSGRLATTDRSNAHVVGKRGTGAGSNARADTGR